MEDMDDDQLRQLKEIENAEKVQREFFVIMKKEQIFSINFTTGAARGEG